MTDEYFIVKCINCKEVIHPTSILAKYDFVEEHHSQGHHVEVRLGGKLIEDWRGIEDLD